MLPIIRFLVKDYFRSANYFAPFLLFAVMVVTQYSYTSNNMIDTYSMTAIYLYFISGWISLKVYTTEDTPQQIITSLNAKSPYHYFCAKLGTSFFVVCILSLFSILYPLITNRIDGPTPLIWIVHCLLVHLLLAALAIIVGALFNPVLVHAKSVSIGATLLVLLLLLTKGELFKHLPEQIQAIKFLLPPLPQLLTSLQADLVNSGAVLQAELWIFGYCVLLAVLYLVLMKKNSGLAGQSRSRK